MSLSGSFVRILKGVAVLTAALFVAAPAFAAPKALSPADLQHYRAAFAAARAGDFNAADVNLSRASDKLLAGYVEFDKLMHPTAHTASYDELDAWLARYADLPGAERVYALAKRRKPAGAPDPRAPMLLSLTSTPSAKSSGAPSPAARNAFYSGNVTTAYRLAANSGERWIAALAAFRLKNYADALRRFEEVASDLSQDDWLRSGAAYWAARAAIADGRPELAPALLAAAARTPWTFYGLIAEAQLGLDPIARFDAAATTETDPDPVTALLVRTSAAAPPAAATLMDLQGFVATELRARRATALIQLDRPSQASGEILLAFSEEGDGRADAWTALCQALMLPAGRGALETKARFNPEDYPVPPLAPKDGFTLSPALVYAIVRQESRFNSSAGSRVGAVGLMQLMPNAAARAAGDDKLLADMSPLLDPAMNLRVGQDYFIWLLERGVGNDMVKAVAAYNAGPGPLLKTVNQLGDDLDTLMLIECLPAQETRNYVEQVLAGYWLYSRQFGEEAPSLLQVASGTPKLSVAINR